MIKPNIKKALSSLSSFGMGVIGHHYGSKWLNASEDQQTMLEAQERENTLNNNVNNLGTSVNEMKDSVNNLGTNVNEMKDNVNNLDTKITDINNYFSNKFQKLEEKLLQNGQSLDELPKDKIQHEEVLKSFENSFKNSRKSLEEGKNYLDQIDVNKDNCESLLSKAKTSFNQGYDLLVEANDKLAEVFNNSKLIPDLDFKSFYKFLDSLTLLEESSLLHILYIIVVLSIIFNIYSAFFANEIIKYFKLEEKYPKLNKIFKLRLQFQRYYLIMNLLWLLGASLFILGLDIMVFGSHFIS